MSKSRFAHLSKLFSKATDDEEEKENAQAVEDEEEKEDEEEAEDEKETNAENSDDEEDEEKAEEKAEEDESPEAKKARKAENSRCAAIFASPHAANHTGMAAHFAFETRMSAKEAIAALALVPNAAPKAKTLDERMQGVKNPRVGSEAPAVQDQSVATRMIEVYKKQGV